MSTSLDQIREYLRARNLEWQEDGSAERLIVPFRLGTRDLPVVVELEEEGRFIEIYAPRVFVYPSGGPHQLPLMQTLLLTSAETRMLQWEYDPSDGEVRAMIEFPLEDSVLTERQFFRAFDELVRLIHVLHPRLQTVIDTGVDPGRRGRGTGLEDVMQGYLAYVRSRPDDDSPPAPDAL
jgi:hypothetical protein